MTPSTSRPLARPSQVGSSAISAVHCVSASTYTRSKNSSSGVTRDSSRSTAVRRRGRGSVVAATGDIFARRRSLPAMLLVTVALAAALAAGPRDCRTVVLHPGHNGRNGAHPERIDRQVHVGGGKYKACNTTGAATASGYAESRYNLAVAREAARILRRHGATVTLTRRSDRGVGPCVTRRARIVNRAQADAAVSIHADGGPPGGRGFHVIRPTLIETG